MKANYKSRIVRDFNYRARACYSVLFARAMMNVIPKHIKTQKTVRGLGLSLLKDFDRVTGMTLKEIDNGLYELDRVVNNLDIADLIITKDIREIAHKKDKSYNTTYLLLGAIFIICYYNIVDDWVKTETTVKAMARDIWNEYVHMCKTGLLNFGYNGKAFIEKIYKDCYEQIQEKE